MSVNLKTTGVPSGNSLKRAKKRSFLIEIFATAGRTVKSLTNCGTGWLTVYGRRLGSVSERERRIARSGLIRLAGAGRKLAATVFLAASWSLVRRTAARGGFRPAALVTHLRS